MNTSKRTTRSTGTKRTQRTAASTVDVSRQLDALQAAKRAGVLTESEYERTRVPLLNALAELDQQERKALAAGGVPLGVSINTPLVVAGELIESAWGNQVRTDLLSLNSGKVEKTGDAISGSLTLSGASTQIVLPNAPTAVNHATRKDYVDTKLSLSGGSMTGHITAPGDPTDNGHLTRKFYVDSTRVGVAGDTMTGDLQIGGTAPTVAGIVLNATGPIVNAVTNTAGGTDATSNLHLNREGLAAGQPGAVGGVYATFRRAGTQIGRIEIQAGPIAQFVASSDPRAKARSGSADDAAEVVQSLGSRAYRGHWRDDDGNPSGDEWVMLNSTDVEEFAPFAVSGEADAVEDDGRPVYQMVNWSGLVPMLFAALSQALARIEVLEAR